MEAISGYKALVAQYGTPILDEQFKELREYANDHKIKLSGFKDYVGDIAVMKTVIDDISEIARDFPDILDDRDGIWLELDYGLGTDFATTRSGHIIHLNAGYFSDVEELQSEYNAAVAEGRFVKGTDWRAIARHEAGHVVAAIYHIDSMDIAKSVFGKKSSAAVLLEARDRLSIYSAEYEDGREIISECFSGYYSNVGNVYADDFVKQVIKEAGDFR